MLRLAERACFASGLALLLLEGAVYLDALLGSRAALADFEQRRLEHASPDQSRWSKVRRTKYTQSLKRDQRPLAVLEIPSVKLEVPVFAGTSQWALNRGVGHVDTTPLPGEAGNSALSGHRDGFFRSLDGVKQGDVLTLRTLEADYSYRVDSISIVDPLDISVLEPTEASVITLITCYPFYYVGSAPDRYIVRATLESNSTPDSRRVE